MKLRISFVFLCCYLVLPLTALAQTNVAQLSVNYDDRELVSQKLTFNLFEISSTIENGQTWGVYEEGLACVPYGNNKWNDKLSQIETKQLELLFYKHFNSRRQASPHAIREVNVSANIDKAKSKICVMQAPLFGLYKIKGAVSFHIIWKLWLSSANTPIYTIETTGKYEIEKFSPYSVSKLITGAFERNIEELINSRELKEAITIMDSQSLPN